MPHRKIRNAAVAAVWTMTSVPLRYLISLAVLPMRFNAFGDASHSEYDTILKRVRNAPILYVDETSIDVRGKKHWIWAFTTPAETFVVIRNSGTR